MGCSKESDPNECTMLVKQYWPICAKCKADVAAVGTLLVSDDAANFAVDRLQGIDFCQDPGFGLKGDDIKTCQMYVGKYIPPIMKHLFNGMGDGAEMICAKLQPM